MAFQLSAVFLILAAIIINSTNSYTKLRELGQSAIEVFFTMENQEASNNNKSEQSTSKTLRLDDLNEEFEKENQVAKQEEVESENEVNEKAETEKVESEKDEMENIVDEENEEDGSKIETDNDSDEDVSEGEENKNDAEAALSKEAFARNFAEYYQIEKGDTLCNISIKVYGDASRVKEICEINKIDDPDNIKYGQKILLP